MTRMIMMLSREVRRVPLDYVHPTDERGRPRAMFLQFYDDALNEWLDRRNEWEQQTGDDYELWLRHKTADEEQPIYACYEGGPPQPEDYLTKRWAPDAEMGIQMWETVSEGSPISAVFPDSDEGRRAMADELARTQGGTITAHFTAADWLEVIAGDVMGTEIGSGAKA